MSPSVSDAAAVAVSRSLVCGPVGLSVEAGDHRERHVANHDRRGDGGTLRWHVVGRDRDADRIAAVAVPGLAEVEGAARLPRDHHAVFEPHVTQRDHVAIGVRRVRAGCEQVVGLRRVRAEGENRDHRSAVANHDRRGDDGAGSGAVVGRDRDADRIAAVAVAQVC